MRKVGLDIGLKRIGVALSDPLFISAQPLITIIRSNFKDEVKAIKEIIKEHDVEEVIVGVPYSLNGTLGPQGKLTLDYIAKLRNELKIPVTEWDERFTTSLAEKPLLLAKLNRDERKKVIDKVAAAIILQSYLENLREKE